MYYSLYTINFPKRWFIYDKPALEPYLPSAERSQHKSMIFHVAAGDYIPTLATILRFFEESIKDNKVTPEMRKLQIKSISELIKDLLYLNKDYKIVPKYKKERE